MFKRVLLLAVLVAVLVALAAPVSAFSPPSDGNGSESNPYVVFFDEPFHAAVFFAEDYGPYYQYSVIEIVRGKPYGSTLNYVISEDASAGAYVMTVYSSGTTSDAFWLRYTHREDDGGNDYLTYERYIYFTLRSVSDPSVSISTASTGTQGVSQPYTLTFSDFPANFETWLYFEVWFEDALVWESSTTEGTNPTFIRDFTPWSSGAGNLTVYVSYNSDMSTHEYVARSPVYVSPASTGEPTPTAVQPCTINVYDADSRLPLSGTWDYYVVMGGSDAVSGSASGASAVVNLPETSILQPHRLRVTMDGYVQVPENLAFDVPAHTPLSSHGSDEAVR